MPGLRVGGRLRVLPDGNRGGPRRLMRAVDCDREGAVTRANRVTPWGQVVEGPERGYFLGNRDYGDAWITCSLRHPDGTTGPSPVAYRKLFFLDEATALAAGHRPCGQCRRKDYDVFKRFWDATVEAPMDPTLRKECEAVAGTTSGRATRRAEQLPSGAMFEVEGEAYLAWQRVAYLWSPGGYTVAGLLKDLGKVQVLTPPSTEHVLEAGYRPWVHPSVMRA